MRIVELRYNRSLLKSNFDGYKLSLEPVPIVRTDLSGLTQPDRVRPADGQYSCFHAQLFGLQNHLVRDPWRPGQCYFFSESWTVQRVVYEDGTGRTRPLSSVFKLARTRHRIVGDYNLTMVLVSEKYALIADGQGGLRLIDTGDRTRGDEWKVKFVFPSWMLDGKEQEQSAAAEKEENANARKDHGFVLLDGRFDIVDGERAVHAVCARVEQVSDEAGFEMVLYWVKAVQPEDGEHDWRYHSVRELRGKGFPYYCALEHRSQSLVISSEKPFRFVKDTANPIVEKPPGEASSSPQKMSPLKGSPQKPSPHKGSPRKGSPQKSSPVAGPSRPKPVTFYWTQTKEEISISIPKEEGRNYRMTNEGNRFQAYCDETLVIDGDKLFHTIDPDLTTWTNEDTEIQALLYKKPSGMLWPVLFPGAPPETKPNERRSTSESESLPPTPNLTTQLEECDFGGTAGPEAEFTIDRIDVRTHDVTHRVLLGANAPLFSNTLRAGFPPAIALRYDVDACLWLQHNPAEWTLRHEGTLNAFGYIQASKAQRKFLSCAPDLSYAMICEAQRNVFIYKAQYTTAGELRNRSGSQVSIGQQQVISVDGNQEILGYCCENEYLLLLTETSVFLLQMGIEE